MPALVAMQKGRVFGKIIENISAKSFVGLCGHEHNYGDVRGEGFFGQTRRERRAYPSAVCEERATKSGRKRTAARRVVPNLACGCVARRSQIHFGIAPSARLAPGQMRRNQRHRCYVLCLLRDAHPSEAKVT